MRLYNILLSSKSLRYGFCCVSRDEYQSKRPPRGVLRSRTSQLAPQESMEDHIRGSVERLDTQVLTLHQDVATLSYEVLQNSTYSL